MEIMKIFSNTEGSERLFSVLVTEEEMALFKEFSDKMSDEEYKAAGKKISKDVSKVGAGIGTALVSAPASGFLAAMAVEDNNAAKRWARMAKKSRGLMEYKKGDRHAFAKIDVNKSRKLVKSAKLKGAASIATGAAALGGLTYAGKKLHDIHKQEKDPRFSKRLQEDLDKK